MASKESRVVAHTTSWGTLFHSAMVRGKNDIFLHVQWWGKSYPKSQVFLSGSNSSKTTNRNSRAISIPLARVFNLLLKEGAFPFEWKEASIILE